jgi:hypothetical protein
MSGVGGVEAIQPDGSLSRFLIASAAEVWSQAQNLVNCCAGIHNPFDNEKS